MTQPEHIKKLEWAIWLSQADLQTLREGDWANLEVDLADFVRGSGTYTDFAPFWNDSEKVQRWIASVQRRLKENFERLATMGEFQVMRVGQGSTAKKLSAMQFMINGRANVEAWNGEPYKLWLRTNTIESQVYSALASYLVSSGIVAGQIRKCPTCGRIFLYKRRPRADVTLHCSLKCSRLAATRRYRGKQGDKLRVKERERGHRRYVEKQRRKFGPKIKVERRPRKTGGA